MAQQRDSMVEKLINLKKQSKISAAEQDALSFLEEMEDDPTQPRCVDDESLATVLKSKGLIVTKKFNESANPDTGKARRVFAGLWDVSVPDR